MMRGGGVGGVSGGVACDPSPGQYTAGAAVVSVYAIDEYGNKQSVFIYKSCWKPTV